MKSKKLVSHVILYFLFQFQIYTQNQPPVLTASGDQSYCPLSQLPIVTSFTITDSDDTTVDSFSVQISGNYNATSDILILTGSHPNIIASWDDREGKLIFTGVGGSAILLTDIEQAVPDVVFQSSDPAISGEKIFSLTVGDANYLPSTQHYYEFVSDIGVSWSQARDLAENRTYFGLRGYLVTITSADEANFVGEQSNGAGWIGGTDQETEGEWKWVTGPESGTIFWYGNFNGSTPNFAFWNSGEPNDFGEGEDYAHITDDSVGIIGSWNDLQLNGDTGVYEPKGYIVEYGGWPDDPLLNISATTRIYIPEIISTTENEICGSGTVLLSANSSEGTILWFDAEVGGNLLGTGTTFTTPVLNSSQNFYVTISVGGCTSFKRTRVTATVNNLPVITATQNGFVCGSAGTLTIGATPSDGIVQWYETLTSTTPIYTGNNLEVSVSSNTDYFVEAISSNGCVSANRTMVSVTTNNIIPEFEVNENQILCLNVGSLDLSILNPNGSDYTYEWKDENGMVVSNQMTANITLSGRYFVQAKSQQGCESEVKTVVVKSSEIATLKLEDIEIIDDSNNNSIIVVGSNLGEGSYEYSIDNINFKENGFFQNLQPGIYTLYVRDKNGCGTLPFEFSVFNYPSFFTPNSDGVKDDWKVEGFKVSEYSFSKIRIFNRFGKLLYENSDTSSNWDGTYNGNILPSDTYWFSVEVTDKNGRIIRKKGPVSLLRK
ncbi:hypothetical protein BTO06_14875 [Tenacibaculum sp. SZ-18]|uniref:Ig-like domain-containing protein n=1 Tax=Tenacibaculum sp. SZ-18 TaxID=754423 RepID=UPI000C2CEFAC|nr:T9SS type B sorting domain-containing protein [Tenacibaculum sp. SZ-18]AUC16354.1 hypothetical protein BTO06_14875 [Tenacibaculum sp. SZ-18]